MLWQEKKRYNYNLFFVSLLWPLSLFFNYFFLMHLIDMSFLFFFLFSLDLRTGLTGPALSPSSGKGTHPEQLQLHRTGSQSWQRHWGGIFEFVFFPTCRKTSNQKWLIVLIVNERNQWNVCLLEVQVLLVQKQMSERVTALARHDFPEKPHQNAHLECQVLTLVVQTLYVCWPP